MGVGSRIGSVGRRLAVAGRMGIGGVRNPRIAVVEIQTHQRRRELLDWRSLGLARRRLCCGERFAVGRCRGMGSSLSRARGSAGTGPLRRRSQTAGRHR